MKLQAIITTEPQLQVAHKQELNADLRIQLAIMMTPVQILDRITDMHLAIIDTPLLISKEDYNWWVDMYNIKRGSIIVKRLD